MGTDIRYSQKQLKVIMERYTCQLLQPYSFAELPVKFLYEFSQYGSSVSCHLRTTEGVVMEVGQLVEWFRELPESEQAEILGA